MAKGERESESRLTIERTSERAAVFVLSLALVKRAQVRRESCVQQQRVYKSCFLLLPET